MKITYKIFLIALIFVSALIGCNLDVNDDPNRVTDKTVTAALIFPAAAHETGQRIASGNFTFLNNWLGYWSGSGTFAIDATETTYNITPAFGDALWQNHYNTLFDLDQTRVKALEQNDFVLAGAAMILSARLWQDLVDIYGNIPYSQTFQYPAIAQPAYDKGQDIYNDLQKKLDLAISYMEKTPLNTFKTVDIVNGGNTTKWIKFANTLKLRLLIHQSAILSGPPTAEIAKIVAKGGVLHTGETVSVNPGYTKAANKQSPFYANYGLTVNNADAAPSVKSNKYFVDQLKTYEDNRLYFLFDSAVTAGVVTPTVYGLTAGNPQTASGVGPGLARSSEQDQWILTSVESMFLETEAIARGWMTGDANKGFRDAVTESFIFLGVEDKITLMEVSVTNDTTYRDSLVSAKTEALYYLDSIGNEDITDYSAVSGGTTKDKVDFIAYQKYIAMCGIDPMEAWTDLRRLGFAAVLEIGTGPGNTGYITANPGKLSNTVPIRLLYPQNEYTTNAANAAAQGTINQFTSKIFWQP